MNHSTGCSPTAGSAFRPAVVGCRDHFDFSIVFEKYFFSIVPSVILILVAPWRLHVLHKLKPKVDGSGLKYLKLVRFLIHRTGYR
jgi:ATP-binding cassette subfamily C (CFTR/MRP) protein 1